MKNQHGITLVELLIALVIIGTMATLAVPSFSAMMDKSNIKTSYNAFAGALSIARAEAVNRAITVTMCVSTDGSSCATNNAKTWSDGYIAFLDYAANGEVSPNDVILKYEAAKLGVTIKSADYATTISVLPRGRLEKAGTFVFCSYTTGVTSDTTIAKALNLWVTGLGRQATDEDNDLIVEDINNDPITCS